VIQPLLKSYWWFNHSRNSSHFMETESSLRCLKERVTCLSLTSARLIHSTSSHVIYLTCNIISFHLNLVFQVVSLFTFISQNPVSVVFLLKRATDAGRLIHLDLITPTRFGEQHK
jgi:hypothetical protein